MSSADDRYDLMSTDECQSEAVSRPFNHDTHVGKQNASSVDPGFPSAKRVCCESQRLASDSSSTFEPRKVELGA